MRIQVHPAALKKNTLGQWAIRFVFGGLITAAAGLIAHRFGPTVGVPSRSPPSCPPA